jgi:16S rRNA (cytosine1402-N4)-methyltransferase
LGMDADPKALDIARRRLASYAEASVLVNDNFKNLEDCCRSHGFYPVDGILLDLGISSLQLDDMERGFSFRFDAPLDMRFSPDQTVTAARIVNSLTENEIATLLREYGEEHHSRLLARRIVGHRPIKTTLDLVDVIERTPGVTGGRIHPATKTFQALRIAVNRELENLEEVLRQTIRVLDKNGRLVVISYHSLEDRLVKKFMHEESRDCLCPPNLPVCTCGHTAKLRLVNRKVITPSDEEQRANIRSRSAKLRAAERL